MLCSQNHRYTITNVSRYVLMLYITLGSRYNSELVNSKFFGKKKENVSQSIKFYENKLYMGEIFPVSCHVWGNLFIVLSCLLYLGFTVLILNELELFEHANKIEHEFWLHSNPIRVYKSVDSDFITNVFAVITYLFLLKSLPYTRRWRWKYWYVLKNGKYRTVYWNRMMRRERSPRTRKRRRQRPRVLICPLYPRCPSSAEMWLICYRKKR